MKGIYLIELGEEKYVGSSSKLFKRLGVHFNLLSNNKHYNEKMQFIFNKIGIENIKFSILETFDKIDKLELFERENYWCDKLKVFNRLPLYKEGNTNFVQKRESIIKVVKSSNKYNPIYQLNEKLEIIQEFELLIDAERITKINRGTIFKSIKDKMFTKGDKIAFCYKKDYPLEIKKCKKPNLIGYKHPVFEVDLFIFNIYGNFITKTTSLEEASNFLKCDKSNIYHKIDKIPKINMSHHYSSNFLISKNLNFFMDHELKWKNLIEEIIDKNGDCKIFDYYQNYLGNTKIDKMSEVLKLNPKSIVNSIATNKKIKTFTIRKDIV
jgi:hypothetical protein